MDQESEVWANGKLRLVVTSECNINCFYCHNEGQPKASVYLDELLFSRIIELGEIERPKTVTITGGEPLLHPRLESFVARLREFSENVTMVSNGLLLTEDRAAGLMDAGLTKFRIGIDSLRRIKSRPTSDTFSSVLITEIIRMIIRRHAALELNVVLTKFNEAEIVDLIHFCAENSISAKVFEHVEVSQYGDLSTPGALKEKPMVTYDSFRSALISTGVQFQEIEPRDYAGANYIFAANGFTVRYCRYLCPYSLCFMAGTRIDPNAIVYVCMEKRGARQIDLTTSAEKTAELIRSVTKAGCC